MTEALLRAALRESVGEVLEKMFFVGDLVEIPAYPAETEISAKLHFEGDPSGSFRMGVTPSVALTVTADFLGVSEEEVTEQQVAEVLCELTNMICGSVLSRVESTRTFRLGSPHLGDSSEDPAGTPPEASASHAVEVLDGVMVVNIRTETSACQTVTKFAS